MPYGGMDQRELSLFKEHGVPLGTVPDDYEGIAYNVSIIFEGALDQEWLVDSAGIAEAQAERIVQNEPDEEGLEVDVTEVYVGADMIEGTGYYSQHYLTKAADK